MSTKDLNKALQAWRLMRPALYVPHTEAQYKQLVKLLDRLIDEVGENEDHELASLMEVIGTLIEKYEDAHVPVLGGSQPSRLKSCSSESTKSSFKYRPIAAHATK